MFGILTLLLGLSLLTGPALTEAAEVLLTWEAAKTGAGIPPPELYEVWRRDGVDTAWKFVGKTTPDLLRYTDTVAPGQTYSYECFAWANGQWSAPSNRVSVTVTGGGPGAPVNLTITVAGTGTLTAEEPAAPEEVAARRRAPRPRPAWPPSPYAPKPQ